MKSTVVADRGISRVMHGRDSPIDSATIEAWRKGSCGEPVYEDEAEQWGNTYLPLYTGSYSYSTCDDHLAVNANASRAEPDSPTRRFTPFRANDRWWDVPGVAIVGHVKMDGEFDIWDATDGERQYLFKWVDKVVSVADGLQDRDPQRGERGACPGYGQDTPAAAARRVWVCW
jgi:hypothetical protein